MMMILKETKKATIIIVFHFYYSSLPHHHHYPHHHQHPQHLPSPPLVSSSLSLDISNITIYYHYIIVIIICTFIIFVSSLSIWSIWFHFELIFHKRISIHVLSCLFCSVFCYPCISHRQIELFGLDEHVLSYMQLMVSGGVCCMHYHMQASRGGEVMCHTRALEFSARRPFAESDTQWEKTVMLQPDPIAFNL